MADPIVFERDLTPYVSGLDRPSLIRAVMDATREFCRRTHIYSVTLTAINVVASDRDYTLTPPTGMEFLNIETVSYKTDGTTADQFRPLVPISTREYQFLAGSDWKNDEASEPDKFWVDEGFILYLKPIPTVASTGGLLVEAAIRPDDDAVTVPAFLVDNWRSAIKYGALAYLFSQGAMPWFDGKGALAYAQLFERQVGDAVWRKLTGPTLVHPRIEIPNFGGGDTWGPLSSTRF
jgi:hypothetical protein